MEWDPAIRHWDETLSFFNAGAGHGIDPPMPRADLRRARRTIPAGIAHAYALCIANTRTRRQQAADVIERAYGRRGYDTDFLGDPARDEGALLTILFSVDDQPAGTFSVRLETPIGVLADHSYKDELDQLRAGGRSVVELSRFAIEPDLPTQVVRQVQAMMVNFLILVCKEFLDPRAVLVIEVNPHHAAVWGALGWTRIGPTRWCERVDAASVLLWADCADVIRHGIGATARSATAIAWKLLLRRFIPWDQADGMVRRMRRGIDRERREFFQ